MLALIKRATSSITLDEIIKKHKGPNMRGFSPKHVVDKSTTLGKVEGSVEVSTFNILCMPWFQWRQVCEVPIVCLALELTCICRVFVQPYRS